MFDLYFLVLKGFFLLALARTYSVYDALQRQWLFFPCLYVIGLAALSWVFVLQMHPGIPETIWQLWLVKSFVLAVVYFLLLARFDEGLMFWIVLIGGWLLLTWF